MLQIKMNLLIAIVALSCLLFSTTATQVCKQVLSAFPGIMDHRRA